MKYYSTNKKAPIADLHKAVVKGCLLYTSDAADE